MLDGRLYAPYGGDVIVDESSRKVFASKGGNIGVKYYLEATRAQPLHPDEGSGQSLGRHRRAWNRSRRGRELPHPKDRKGCCGESSKPPVVPEILSSTPSPAPVQPWQSPRSWAVTGLAATAPGGPCVHAACRLTRRLVFRGLGPVPGGPDNSQEEALHPVRMALSTTMGIACFALAQRAPRTMASVPLDPTGRPNASILLRARWTSSLTVRIEAFPQPASGPHGR